MKKRIKEIINDHFELATIITGLFSIIALFTFLFLKGKSIKDCIHGDLFIVLGIAFSACIIIIPVFHHQTGKDRNPQTVPTFKGLTIATPLIFLVAVLGVYPLIDGRADCKLFPPGRVQHISDMVEQRTEAYKLDCLKLAAVENNINNANICQNVFRYQALLADSLVSADSSDESCSQMLKDSVSRQVALQKNRVGSEIGEIVGLTKSIQQMLEQKNADSLDAIMRRYGINESAEVYEYDNTLEEPAKYSHLFTTLIKNLINGNESKRYITAVIRIEKENDIISDIYIVTQ